MSKDKNLWIIISTILSCTSILAYLIFSGCNIEPVYSRPVTEFLNMIGASTPFIAKFLFAISMCFFAVASALIVDAYSSGRTSSILLFIFLSLLAPIFHAAKLSTLSPLVAALTVMGVYFVLRGRKTLKAYTVKSKSGGLLSNPQAGRSAIRAHTKLRTRIITKDLIISALCFTVAGLISPFPVYAALAGAVFSLSYSGDFLRRIFRSLLYTLGATSSTVILALINYLGGSLQGKISSFSTIVSPLKKGFFDSLYLGYDRVNSLTSSNDLLSTIVYYSIRVAFAIVVIFFTIRVIMGIVKSLQRGLGSSYSEGNEFPYFGSYAFNLPSTFIILALIGASFYMIMPAISEFITMLYGKDLTGSFYCLGYLAAALTKILVLDGAICLFSGASNSGKKKVRYSFGMIISFISVTILSVPWIMGGLYIWL